MEEKSLNLVYSEHITINILFFQLTCHTEKGTLEMKSVALVSSCVIPFIFQNRF